MEETLNNGRIYKCGSMEPCSNKLKTMSLIDFFSKNKNFKEQGWRRRILRGQISVDGTFIDDPDHKLNPGQNVKYHRLPWIEPKIRVRKFKNANHMNDEMTSTQSNLKSLNQDESHDRSDEENPHELKIIYQDEDMMVVHKPSGLPTMPSQTYYEYSILNALRRSSQSYSAPPQPVHRLGVGTSGLLIIATSLQARKQLTDSIRNKRVIKVYRALVHGANIPNTLTIDCPIGPVAFPIGSGTIHAACPPDHFENNEIGKKAKSALSLVRVVKRNLEDDTAVVEVEIPTGRPHQIRIHMAYAGFPLVGDPLYLKGGIPDCNKKLFLCRRKMDEDMDTDEENSDTNNDFDETKYIMRYPLPRDCGYFLHAYQITIPHPIRLDEEMKFMAKPPKCLTA
jgi:23S rRNA pseudouridine1911/1915/1917 synthase